MSLRSEKSIEIWSILENIRCAVNVTHDAFSEMLGLTKREYDRFFKIKKMPSVTQIFRLLEHVNLSFESVLSGKIDYKALASSHRKDDGVLPEKYQIAAFSKARTIHSILRYLECFHGWMAAEAVIRNFQIPNYVLNNSESAVNIKMIAEIYEYASQYFIHPSLLGKVGEFSRVVNSGGHIEKTLSKHSKLEDLYSHVFDELITRFDENFDYSIRSMKKNILTVGVLQKLEISQTLNQRYLSNEVGCSIRGGVGSSFSGYMNLPHAQVTESKCVHRGDALCLYEFNFGDAVREQRSRLLYGSLLLHQ